MVSCVVQSNALYRSYIHRKLNAQETSLLIPSPDDRRRRDTTKQFCGVGLGRVVWLGYQSKIQSHQCWCLWTWCHHVHLLLASLIWCMCRTSVMTNHNLSNIPVSWKLNSVLSVSSYFCVYQFCFWCVGLFRDKTFWNIFSVALYSVW